MNWIDWCKSRVKKFSGSRVTEYFQKLGPEISIVCRNQRSVSSNGGSVKGSLWSLFCKVMRVIPS